VYSKVNPADTPIVTLGLTSATLPLPQVEDLADTRLAQKIAQLPGVGLVSISGGQAAGRRAGAGQPGRALGLRPHLEDLRAAVAAANVQPRPRAASTGRASPRSSGQRPAPDEPGLPAADRRVPQQCPVTLENVADVIDDAENVRQAAWMNGTPAVILNIQRQPGAT